METTKKERYTLLALALFPCMGFGLITLGCIMTYHLKYPEFISNHIFRITYLLRALLCLSLLRHVYKKWLPHFYDEKIYVKYSLLAIISIVCGFFIKTKFWNYILDGCFVSPFIEELIARFMLYEARNHSWKLYAVVAFLSSLTFSLMHIGYDLSSFTKSTLLPKLSEHFLFGCILCSIFWFFPRLGLLISIHAISNLWWIVNMAAELGCPW